MGPRTATPKTGTNVSVRETSTFNTKHDEGFSEPSNIKKAQKQIGLTKEMQDFGHYVRWSLNSIKPESTPMLFPEGILPAALAALPVALKLFGGAKAGIFKNSTNAVGTPNAGFGSGTAAIYPMVSANVYSVKKTTGDIQQTPGTLKTKLPKSINTLPLDNKRKRRGRRAVASSTTYDMSSDSKLDKNDDVQQAAVSTRPIIAPKATDHADLRNGIAFNGSASLEESTFQTGEARRATSGASSEASDVAKSTDHDVEVRKRGSCDYNDFGKLDDPDKMVSYYLNNVIKQEIKHYYDVRFKRCPGQNDVNDVHAIASYANSLLHNVTKIMKSYDPNSYQSLTQPVVELFADALFHSKVMLDNLLENIGLTDLPKIIVLSSLERNPRTHLNSLTKLRNNKYIFPKIAFKDNKLKCYIDGAWRELRCEDYNIIANYGKKYELVWYSVEHNKWYRTHQCSEAVPSYLEGRRVYACFWEEKNKLPVYRIIGGSLGDIYDIDYVLTKNRRLIPYSHFAKPRKELMSSKWIEPPENCYANALPLNGKGLKEETFCDYMYVIDKRGPREIAATGFGHTQKFGRVANMTEGDALIASSTYKGALRRLYNKEKTYHIYRLPVGVVKGVSLKRNIHQNKQGTAKFLNVLSHNRGFIDWVNETQGAIHFDEVHLSAESVYKLKEFDYFNPQKVQCDLARLKVGSWINWV